MNRTNFIILYLSCIMLLVIAGVAIELSVFQKADSAAAMIASFLFFDNFILELLIVIVVSLWLINSQSKWFRITGYSITSIFIAINLAQLIAMRRGGEFLSRLALENINHVSIIATKSNLISVMGLIFVCLLLPVINEQFIKRRGEHKPLIPITIVLLIGILLISQNERLLAKSVLEYKQDYLYNNLVKSTSPSVSLYNILFKKPMPVISHDFSKEEIRELNKYGFFYNSQSQYPLTKNFVYQGKLPFDSVTGTPEKPNVIVFFTEGYAARTMGVYGSKLENITPNLNEFSKQTMIVENYYNHTAATYRGLHGELCSLYPFYGGNGGWDTNYKDMPKRSYYCLNNVFSQNGYDTIFFDSHRKDNAYVDELVRDLGFDSVLTAEELSKTYLQGEEPHRTFALSDNQFYKSFVNFLKSRESSDKPFFAGLYNLETHAFIDVDNKSGKQYGDGTNNALNTIHNLDHAFGQFLRYFKNSPYAKNTIVVFTTDHTHYTEKTFTKAVKDEDYQRLFVDKIPLLIYDPTHKLPERYNANNATSIDFAPSMLHLLGFSNEKNPFLGGSIFSKNRKKYMDYGVASYGSNYYLIDNEKIHALNLSKSHQKGLELIAKFIKVSQQKEIDNKLWHDNN